MASEFERLVSPQSLSGFIQDHYNQKAVLLRDPSRSFSSLFGWEQLNRVLNSAPSVHPTVRLTKDEKKIPIQDSIDIINQVRSGSTLIFEHLDRYDPRVGTLADAVSHEVCEDTRVNLYASCPGHRGFLCHYDTQDVFMLQIEGIKRWRVFSPTVEAPIFFQKMHGMEAPGVDDQYLDVQIAPGDVLYIPRGHWHDAFAESEPTMHLTLSIFVRTGIDFFAWLVNELREIPEFRRSLPFLPGVTGARDRWPRDTALHVQHLCDLLRSQIEDPAVVHAFDQHRVATQRDRAPFRFPHHFAIPSEGILDYEFERPLRPFLIGWTDDGRVQLTVRGLVLCFPKPVESLIKLIFERTQFIASDLVRESTCEMDTARDVLRTLTQEGLIGVVAR
jgi:ribosomal protein L16 Arg81 hydroxylase